jgi:hypothetical protein
MLVSMHRQALRPTPACAARKHRELMDGSGAVLLRMGGRDIDGDWHGRDWRPERDDHH